MHGRAKPAMAGAGRDGRCLSGRCRCTLLASRAAPAALAGVLKSEGVFKLFGQQSFKSEHSPLGLNKNYRTMRLGLVIMAVWLCAASLADMEVEVSPKGDSGVETTTLEAAPELPAVLVASKTAAKTALGDTKEAQKKDSMHEVVPTSKLHQGVKQQLVEEEKCDTPFTPPKPYIAVVPSPLIVKMRSTELVPPKPNAMTPFLEVATTAYVLTKPSYFHSLLADVV